jgi:hypothetical protein
MNHSGEPRSLGFILATSLIFFESHAPHSFGRFKPLAAGCQANRTLHSRQRQACALGPSSMRFARFNIFRFIGSCYSPSVVT